MDFKNVQRRVYDALNVLSAMDIIRKDKYNIIYNHKNEHIPIDLPANEQSDYSAGYDDDYLDEQLDPEMLQLEQ